MNSWKAALLSGTISILFIGFVLNISILIKMIRQFKSSMVQKKIQYLSIFHVLIWSIKHLLRIPLFIADIYRSTNATQNQTTSGNSNNTLAFIVSAIVIFIVDSLAEYSFFVLILYRLFFTFQLSAYKVNAYLILVFGIISTIAALVRFGCHLLVVRVVVIPQYNSDYGFYGIIGSSIALIIIGVMVVYLFSANLFKIVKLTNQTGDHYALVYVLLYDKYP